MADANTNIDANMADANTNIDANIKIAYFHDPVKWLNPKYPKYPKPDVQERIRVTSMTLVEVTAQDLLGGCLTRDGFNVLLIPGGFAPHWSDALGDDGERIIQRFVASGGGYVVYVQVLTTACVGPLPAEVVDIEHWQRGSTARCEIRWSSAGIDLLGALRPRLCATTTALSCAALALSPEASPTLRRSCEGRRIHSRRPWPATAPSWKAHTARVVWFSSRRTLSARAPSRPLLRSFATSSATWRRSRVSRASTAPRPLPGLALPDPLATRRHARRRPSQRWHAARAAHLCIRLAATGRHLGYAVD